MRARKTIKDKSKKAYEDYVPEGVRAAIEANLVPGTSVRPVTEDDYEDMRYRKIFVRWAREEYLLNVPDAAHLDDGKAKDSFAELFVPKWNSGELDPWYYNDGREFEFQGRTWYQTWM